MKAKSISQPKNCQETYVAGTIALTRAKEIMREEEIEYTDEEVKEVLQFVSKVVSISCSHYERTKQNQAKIININTNTTHETTSLSLHPCQHRRAS